jgi:hypothetical protein
MTPAEAAREVALSLSCAGMIELDRIAAAFEMFAGLLETQCPTCKLEGRDRDGFVCDDRWHNR